MVWNEGINLHCKNVWTRCHSCSLTPLPETIDHHICMSKIWGTQRFKQESIASGQQSPLHDKNLPSAWQDTMAVLPASAACCHAILIALLHLSFVMADLSKRCCRAHMRAKIAAAALSAISGALMQSLIVQGRVLHIDDWAVARPAWRCTTAGARRSLLPGLRTQSLSLNHTLQKKCTTSLKTAFTFWTKCLTLSATRPPQSPDGSPCDDGCHNSSLACLALLTRNIWPC